ncbi:MAG: serine hydrolase [Gemmatimonadota bacterium]
MHPTHRWILALTLLLAAGPMAAQSDPGIDLGRLERVIDSIAYRAIATRGTPGVSVAVAKDGQVVFAKGYGESDIEHAVAARPETVYRIGSITKQFTAAIIMRLVERGEIALDDPVTRFLPEYDMQGHTVTVRHLLNHTSGIFSYTSLGEDAWQTIFRHDLTDRELIDLFEREPFDFEPGAEQRYNNSAYVLLGPIIEAVTGTPYARYLEEELLAPLGLEHTAYCDVTRIVPHRASGYEDQEGEWVNASFLSMNVPGGAGAMCSTVGDLSAWTRMLHRGEVVSAGSLQEMTTPTVVASGDTIPYGFGLAVGELEGHPRVGHDGGINGFISSLVHYPDDGVTVVVLTNSGSGPAGAVQGMVSRAALGLELPRVVDRPVTESLIQRVVGTYVLQLNGNSMELIVFDEEGQLMGQVGGQAASRLRWQGDTTFVLASNDGLRFVFEPAEGPAQRVVLHQDDVEVPGERVR